MGYPDDDTPIPALVDQGLGNLRLSPLCHLADKGTRGLLSEHTEVSELR